MITQKAVNYAKVLYSLQLQEETVSHAKKLLVENEELVSVFESPIIEKKDKEAVIDALFHQEIGKFLKVLCDNKSIGMVLDIIASYENMLYDSKNILPVKLFYAVKPDGQELEQMKDSLCQKYNKTQVLLELVEDASLIGGYVLTVGDTEYDKSIKGAMQELKKALVGR